MHGVQPMAKIAPSANDVPRPALPPTSRLPTRPPIPGVDRRQRHATGHRGHARGGAGIEGPPRPLEEGDRQEPGEAEAHHDEDHATDDAEQRDVVGEGPAGEGGRDPEQGEDRAEPRDVGDGVAQRDPARRPARRVRARGDRDRGELAEVRRNERQDARRQERDDAGADREEERVVAGHARVPDPPSSPSASRRRSRARARGQLQAALAELDDRDGECELPLPVFVRIDVALQRGAGPRGREPLGRRAGSRARPASRRTGCSRGARTGSGRAGEGSRRAHCRRAARIDPGRPRGCPPARGVDRAQRDASRCSSRCRWWSRVRACTVAGGLEGSGAPSREGRRGLCIGRPAAGQHGHHAGHRPRAGEPADAWQGRPRRGGPDDRLGSRPPDRLPGPGGPAAGSSTRRSSSSRRTAGSSSRRSAAPSRSSTA